MEHIAIIHSYRVGVINDDNKMITLAHIDMIIWRYALITFVRLFLTKVVVGGAEETSKISVKDLEGEIL